MKPVPDSRLFKTTGLFALVVVVLFALHQDFWLRDNPSLIAGLPIGLLYHLGYCVLVSMVLAAFISRRRQ
ncbi:MAG: hypothetical protein GY769_11640 [bacterium]|nr:hypothetical protein [bacterium]